MNWTRLPLRLNCLDLISKKKSNITQTSYNNLPIDLLRFYKEFIEIKLKNITCLPLSNTNLKSNIPRNQQEHDKQGWTKANTRKRSGNVVVRIIQQREHRMRFHGWCTTFTLQDDRNR